MRYILEGKPSEVEKVIRENRIRIGRGDINITPFPRRKSRKEEEPATEDSKNVEVEDFKEVDLDSDVKAEPVEDSKEVTVGDTKEVAPVKKTSRRTKKSE